ncbi:MAG: hypothetical protein IJV25_08985 [Prevotella sp.]|nr:hypothetical protein [Prevotella sp.]
MKKKSWIKVLAAAVALCLTAGGCSKESGSTPEEDFKDNFKALVMGGKQVDTLQDWSTSTGLEVKISVDFGNTMEYRVYILPTPALYDASATYLGMARMKSGESKTITVCRPAQNALLYAACFDSDGHAVCKPFPAKASGSEVIFNGQQPESRVNVQQPTGGGEERWSVPIMQMPDVTDYTTGSFIEVSSLESEPEGSDRLRLSISNDYTGYLPSLGIRGNMVVYVSGTWTLSFNQRVSNGNVLIVGSGGKVVIPEGMTLSASPFANGSTGQIYILPGGEITGEGTLEYNTGSGTYNYNSGFITSNEIRLKGCTLYNSNILGREVSTPTSVTCTANDDGEQGVLINRGGAWLQQISGENFSLQNATYMQVSQEVTLSESSRLDDWSFIQCPSLVLSGSAEGNKVVYMGNGATIETTDITIDNFGVWGPTGDNFTANALLKVDNCNGCVTTDGQAGTYLLDHVELILPTSFPVSYDIDHISNNNRLLYYWLNACEGRLINTNNYTWQLVGNKDALVWNDGVSDNGCGDASRQTCTYGISASYNTTYMKKTSSTVPEPNGVYYAFETIESSVKDYDYNDVVLRVGVPVDRGAGIYTSNVLVMCVGNSIKTNIIYDGSDFGGEVHSVMGVATDKPANIVSINRVFSKLGEISFPDGNVRIDQLRFSLRTQDDNGNIRVQETGETPLYFVINGSTDRRWFWPTEGLNIGVAYPQLSYWASNMHTAINWYAGNNAAAGKVVTWTSADE